MTLLWLACAWALAGGPSELAPVHFAGLTVQDAGWPLATGDASQRFVATALRKGALEVVDPGARRGPAAAAPLTLEGAVVRTSERSRMLFTELEVEIAWTLRDAATGDEVYRGTTSGYAVTRGGVSRGVVAYDALEDAVLRLAAREPLRALLTRVGPAPAPLPSEPDAPVQLARCRAALPPLPKGLDEASKAAVTLAVPDGSTGSAFLVSPDGWALTAAHVVGEHDEVDVLVRSGPRLTAEVVRRDHVVDVALLRVPGRAFPCLPLGAEPPTLGSDLFVIGSPLGAAFDVSVSRGIVSGFRTFDGHAYLQTDAAVNPGSSGGPMLDARGDVVALTSWKVVGKAEGLGFGVPVEAALEALGIRVGDTSAMPVAAVPRPLPAPTRPVAALQRVQDEIDPSRMGTLTPAIDRRVRGTGLSLLGSGALLGGLGAMMAVTSYDTWTTDPTKTRREVRGAQTLNALGWTSAATGASLAIVGATVLGSR